MRKEYDFSNAEKNPYIKKLKADKQQITINLNVSIIEYFKEMSVQTGIPYQTLINLYLDDCVKSHRKIQFI